MRLTILDSGHRLPARLFMALTSRLGGSSSPDIVRTLLYRPEFFSSALLALTADAMRGPSFWTAGEREYIAMTTAQWHQCPFCIDTHAELTRIAGNGEIDPSDPASARPALSATVSFLETVTRTPEKTATPPDIPTDAIDEALRANLIWNVVNRIANAFGFVLREGQLKSGTAALHRFGYRFPGFLTGGRLSRNRAELVDDLRRTVRKPDGDEWYVDLVRDVSYRITDADINRLLREGRTEDDVFELTVAAAVDAALRSYDAGARAISPSP
jgi:AhpD family alkylhydroperoxidase